MLVQVARYGVVGVINNLAGYLIYLGVTWLGLEPKLAVTVLYPIGIIISYFGHARYTFFHNNANSSTLIRFVLAYLIGYVANIALLYMFVDQLGFPHQLVQASAIFIVAGLLFLLLRYFVFPVRPAT